MRQLWSSPTLRSATVYGVSGVGFAGANLILARVLPTAEYGVFTLAIALANLGFSLAPAGVDGIVNRKHLEAGPGLLRRTLMAAVLVGLGLVIVARVAYGMNAPLLLAVFVSTVAGGAMAVAGAQFQSEQRYNISLTLTQSPNLVLLLAAILVVVSSSEQAWHPLVIYAFGFVLAGTYGWWRLFRERHVKPFRSHQFPWTEALSFAGLNAAGLLLLQLDRLIIPHVLPLRDLATFGVLASTAGALFRVLQLGVGYSLVPRLRAATSVLERRQLIAREAKLVGTVVVAGSAVVWLVMPLVQRWLLADKYHLAGSLVLATLISGMTKITNSFTKSVVSALATPGELATVNLFGWFSVALAVPAAVFGARWGLAGVIYGVSFGWLTRALSAILPAIRHLKTPVSSPSPSVNLPGAVGRPES